MISKNLVDVAVGGAIGLDSQVVDELVDAVEILLRNRAASTNTKLYLIKYILILTDEIVKVDNQDEGLKLLRLKISSCLCGIGNADLQMMAVSPYYRNHYLLRNDPSWKV